MKEIRCLKDITNLKDNPDIPKELIEDITQDLHIIHNWDDQDHEWSFEEFNTDYTNNGYIAILEGMESEDEIKELGLSGGLSETIPEVAEHHYYSDDKWTRTIIIYNDSYAMIIWLKNYDGFDSYAATPPVGV